MTSVSRCIQQAQPLAPLPPVLNFPPFQTFLYSTSTSSIPASRVQPPPFPNLPVFNKLNLQPPFLRRSTSPLSKPPTIQQTQTPVPHPPEVILPPFPNLPVFNKYLQSPSSVFNLPLFSTFLYSTSSTSSPLPQCSTSPFPKLPVFSKLNLQSPSLLSSTSSLSKSPRI